MYSSSTKTLLFLWPLFVQVALSRNVPYLRNAMMNMMDDDQNHHDWMGTMHPSSSYHHNSTDEEADGNITSCEPPLGPIREHWWFLPNSMMGSYSMMGATCNNNTGACCGPLVEIHNCTAPAQPFPGLWNGSMCWGYSANDCCFTEDGSTNFTFTDCYDSQEKIGGAWVDFHCTHYSMSECCGPPTNNFTTSSCALSDYVWPCEGHCCGVQQNWTFCPLETEPWPQGWTGDVCLGLLEECCFAPQNITNCTDFPYEWPCNGPCCAVEHHFTNCPQNSLPMPGWTNGECDGMMEHCCYLDTGNELVTFTSCPDSLPKLLDHWVGDTCTAASLSTCCATPQNYTNCTKSAAPWPHMWHDGYCLGSFHDCCYEETGSNLYNFTGCFESQQKIPGQWNGDVCSAHHLSACCNGTFSTMDGSVYFLSSNSAGSSIGLGFGLVFALVGVVLQ